MVKKGHPSVLVWSGEFLNLGNIHHKKEGVGASARDSAMQDSSHAKKRRIVERLDVGANGENLRISARMGQHGSASAQEPQRNPKLRRVLSKRAPGHIGAGSLQFQTVRSQHAIDSYMHRLVEVILQSGGSMWVTSIVPKLGKPPCGMKIRALLENRRDLVIFDGHNRVSAVASICSGPHFAKDADDRASYMSSADTPRKHSHQPPPPPPPPLPHLDPQPAEPVIFLVQSMRGLDEMLGIDETFWKPRAVSPKTFWSAIRCEIEPDGRIAWMAIATYRGSYIIDCNGVDEGAVCEALCVMLENKHVVKIFHDLRACALAVCRRCGMKGFEAALDMQLVIEHSTGIMDAQLAESLHHITGKPPSSEVSTAACWRHVHPVRRPLPERLVNDEALIVMEMLKLEESIRAEYEGQPFDVLTVASDNLSRDIVFFGGKRRVCFDSIADFALRSSPLTEAARNEDIVELEMTENSEKDLKSLLEMLPESILTKMTDEMKRSLLDLNLTVGCEATVRSISGEAEHLDVRVMRRDLEEVLWHAGPVRRGGRAVLEGKLHRIGVMCNHDGKPYSLTVRVGRHVKGVAQPILDILRGMHDKCVLIIGPPSRLVAVTAFFRTYMHTYMCACMYVCMHTHRS
jgi:hypothetical protein